MLFRPVLILLSVFIFLTTSGAYPQCCSVNPVAGATSIGILSKKTLRTITFYRHTYSDTYYEGTKIADVNLIKLSDFDFLGSILSYGLTQKLTLEAEVGYFIRKREIFNPPFDRSFIGWGFSNGVASLKYNIYNRKEIEITAGAGLKFPFSRTLMGENGVQLPRSVQPSNSAMGGVFQLFVSKNISDSKLRLFLINRFDVNAKNQFGYTYGYLLNNAFFITKTFKRSFTGIFQLRNEFRGYDYREGDKIAASGGNTVIISPQINYTLKQKWNISVLVDLPVFRYNNGIQLSNKYAYSLNVIRDFNF